MARLKVRCCCTPTKVYGTLAVPDSVLRVGMRVALYPRGPLSPPSRAAEPTGPVTIRTMDVHQFQDYDGRRELALKYEGDDETPEQKLAFLRTIKGFTEA